MAPTKAVLVLLFVAHGVLTWGQKDVRTVELTNDFDHLTTQRISLEFTVADAENDNQLIAALTNNLLGNWDSLAVVNRMQSPAGHHVLVGRYLNGYRIYGCDIKVNLNFNGTVRSAYLLALPEMVEKNIDPSPAAGMAWLNRRGTIVSSTSELVYFPMGSLLRPSVAHTIHYEDHRHEEWVFGPTETPYYWRDLNRYADTTLEVMVFNPDPLTSANVIYGAPYLDQNDADVTVLNAERVQKTVTGLYFNGLFLLENSYVRISEFDIPTVAPATSLTNQLFFTRSQSGFEDVNAFYHISVIRNHLSSMGFTNLANYQIQVDAHAFNGQDNSMFSSATNPPRLFFGEGGVDDAEDADVIVHEYGHAISNSAAPGTNFGVERLTLEEANADYLAVSYSKHLNPSDGSKVFTWDGHNEYWGGRNAYSNKNYSTINFGSVVNIYEHTDLWVAALMEGWMDIGRTTMDKLVLTSLYSQAAQITFPQMAWEILSADSVLYGGAHVSLLYANFVQYGILPPAPISVNDPGYLDYVGVKLKGTRNFSHGEPLTIDNPNLVSLSGELINAAGQVLLNFSSNDEVIRFGSANLPAGVYVLRLSYLGGSKQYKLIKS